MLFVLGVMLDCNRISFLSSQVCFHLIWTVRKGFRPDNQGLNIPYCLLLWRAKARGEYVKLCARYLMSGGSWQTHIVSVSVCDVLNFIQKLSDVRIYPVLSLRCLSIALSFYKRPSTSLRIIEKETTTNSCFATDQNLQVGALQPDLLVLKHRLCCILAKH